MTKECTGSVAYGEHAPVSYERADKCPLCGEIAFRRLAESEAARVGGQAVLFDEVKRWADEHESRGVEIKYTRKGAFVWLWHDQRRWHGFGGTWGAALGAAFQKMKDGFTWVV